MYTNKLYIKGECVGKYLYKTQKYALEKARIYAQQVDKVITSEIYEEIIACTTKRGQIKYE